MMKSIDVTMKILFMLDSFFLFFFGSKVMLDIIKFSFGIRVLSIELEQRHRL